MSSQEEAPDTTALVKLAAEYDIARWSGDEAVVEFVEEEIFQADKLEVYRATGNVPLGFDILAQLKTKSIDVLKTDVKGVMGIAFAVVGKMNVARQASGMEPISYTDLHWKEEDTETVKASKKSAMVRVWHMTGILHIANGIISDAMRHCESVGVAETPSASDALNKYMEHLISQGAGAKKKSEGMKKLDARLDSMHYAISFMPTSKREGMTYSAVERFDPVVRMLFNGEMKLMTRHNDIVVDANQVPKGRLKEDAAPSYNLYAPARMLRDAEELAEDQDGPEEAYEEDFIDDAHRQLCDLKQDVATARKVMQIIEHINDEEDRRGRPQPIPSARVRDAWGDPKLMNELMKEPWMPVLLPHLPSDVFEVDD